MRGIAWPLPASPPFSVRVAGDPVGVSDLPELFSDADLATAVWRQAGVQPPARPCGAAARGVAAPPWTVFTVVAPQVGRRILVYSSFSANYGWIDEAGVGPAAGAIDWSQGVGRWVSGRCRCAVEHVSAAVAAGAGRLEPLAVGWR